MNSIVSDESLVTYMNLIPGLITKYLSKRLNCNILLEVNADIGCFTV